MNVEIGAEAAQFPEKEYINGIAVAVWFPTPASLSAVNIGRIRAPPYCTASYTVKTRWRRKLSYSGVVQIARNLALSVA